MTTDQKVYHCLSWFQKYLQCERYKLEIEIAKKAQDPKNYEEVQKLVKEQEGLMDNEQIVFAVAKEFQQKYKEANK